MKKEEKNKISEDLLTQKVIDPETGNNITGQYIGERLAELRVIADEIISEVKAECEKFPGNKQIIYENGYWELHERIGTGSIGPATAAAGPLLLEKKAKLAKVLQIETDRILL